MSDLLFPILPGMSYDVEREPYYSTNLFVDGAGIEYATAWQTTPRTRYALNFRYLRDNVNAAGTFGSYASGSEVNTLRSFFDQHQGRRGNFLFADPETGATVRVRFDSDALRLKREAMHVWSGSVALVTVKGYSVPAITYTTATTVASSSIYVAPGAAVTLSATVSALSGTPAGTVTFTDGVTNLGTATLVNGSGSITTTSLTAVGSHSIVASYGGAPSYTASASSALTVTVSNSTTATTTTLTSTPNPSQPGASVAFTVTVSGTGTPTGSVSISEGGASLWSGSLASGSASAILALAVGTHNLVASYSGDGTHAGSSSSVLAQVVAGSGTQVSTTYRLYLDGSATAFASQTNTSGSASFSVAASSLSVGTGHYFEATKQATGETESARVRVPASGAGNTFAVVTAGGSVNANLLNPNSIPGGANWTQSGLTAFTPNRPDPNGGTDAARVQAAAGTGTLVLYSATVTASTQYTLSWWGKLAAAATGGRLVIAENNGGTAVGNVSLDNDYGDELSGTYTRVSRTFTTSATTNNLDIYLCRNAAAATDLDLAGVKLEVGASATGTFAALG